MKNKTAFQEELGLAKDENRFMIGLVSRLTIDIRIDRL